MRGTGEPLDDFTVIRFRSGANYNYAGIRIGDVWRTTASRSPRSADDSHIEPFAWNPINKIEHFADLSARSNSFFVATDWTPAPALIVEELAVVRFLLEDTSAWHSAIHVGRRVWYSTVSEEEFDDNSSGLRVYETPPIRGWPDIVDNSVQVDLATAWEPIPGLDLRPGER
jgi:hypothetical protein